MDEHISSMLQLKLCAKKYIEMISIIKEKNISPTVGEIIKIIKKTTIHCNL